MSQKVAKSSLSQCGVYDRLLYLAAMENLTGCVEHLTYADPESFFTVANLLCPGQKKPVIITGIMPAIQVGETISCQGVFKAHPKHGVQFEVSTYELQLPQDSRSIEKFLASGAVKGIGPAFAARLVERFGKDTLKVIDKEPHLLNDIEGLGQKRLNTLVASWQEQKSLKELFVFLQGYGISQAYAKKILRHYGCEAIQKIKQNPYSLAKEVHGMGFRLADTIAKNLGFTTESVERISAGIDFVLYELAQEGQVCYPLELFITRAIETLSVAGDLIRLQTGRLFQAGEIELQNQQDTLYIWSKPLYLSEVGIAHEVKRLKTTASPLRQVDIDKAIIWSQDKLYLRFAPLQETAVRQVLQEKVSIITGGPGTGKSTITKALVAIFEKLTDKILLVAPTGRAAKRLAEITHKYASTIHRTLKYDFTKGRFKYDKDNPLTCDLIIIDESSMIDTYLMYQLLRAIPSSSKLVIIGDVNQLPSIGPGTVLADFINSQTIPTVRLNAIFRQAAGSKIILNAHRINEGKMPFTENFGKSDFFFVEAKEPEDVKKTILDLVTKKIPQEHRFDSKKDIQVLVPMRKGICGIDALNRELQLALTPQASHYSLRVGDKVMQLRNNYSKDVYNGDIGYVTSIDMEDEKIYIQMDDKEVIYEFTETDELVLAYAVSIHKYQGSECPCIVMPVHTTHFKLLTKNLLYTGVTRGKKLVFLVGTKKALAIAVKNEDVMLRYTGLKTRLQT